MKRATSVLFLIVIGVIFYGLTLRGTAGNFTRVSQLKPLEQTGQAFESSHERASYAEMISLRTFNSAQLSTELRAFAAPDVGYIDNTYYSYFPPGIALFIWPFFELGFTLHLSLLFAYASISLLAIFTMIFIYLICVNVFDMPSAFGIIAALMFAFASTSWSYAITIYQHIPAAFFAAVMFYGVSRYRARAKTSALWASLVWFVYGISIMFDYPNGLLLSPFIVYYVVSSFEIIQQEQKLKLKLNPMHFGVAIWFFIAVAFHIGYNMLYLNNWHAIRQTFSRYNPSYNSAAIVKQAKEQVNVVTTENTQPEFKQRFELPFVEELFINGLYTLFVAPDKGLFYFSPVFLFSLAGVYFAIRKKPGLKDGVLLAFMAINVFLYASFPDPYGGWAFGPRYLIPAMVGLSVYAVYGLYRLRNTIANVIFYALFLFSMSVSAAGALTTNKVPPKVEAVYLKQQYYNYALNFKLLDTKKTGSFVYNSYLTRYMNLSDLYVLIVLSLGLIMFCIMFVSPLFFKPEQ